MNFTGERLVPDEQRQDDLYAEHLVRYLFAAQFARARAVLDAGCGAGYGAALLADSSAGSVLGVDLAADAIDYARRRYQRPNLSFAIQDLAAPDLPPASFDLVVSFEVIEHLNEPHLLVDAAARLLRPGGLFIVSTPNPATYPAGNPFHKHEVSLDEFSAVLRQSFAALAIFEQDYATALSLRPAPNVGVGAGSQPARSVGDDARAGFKPAPTSSADVAAGPQPARSPASWQLVPAEERQAVEPDYYVAICAGKQDTLEHALEQTHSIMYELAADRLGERIRDAQTLQAIVEDKNRHLAEKDAHIAHLEAEMRRQAAWAADLERRLLELNKAWYVRLFSRNR